ncbi:beta-glucosidase 17-like isoform X2 [Corylus avellana]|uniref:beta-glucosidase 17-like isoform X2 n=1 Tax=Corylus avellana TaxID=13451 RepID=UPI00286A47AB|nr:beta-glucosidase 17-like isoform X2 [Corylus avellana]
MEILLQHPLLFYLLALASSLACTESLSRTDFPAGFVFGAGSSAYQYEGAAHQDGKGSSIWDTFTRIHPEKISDHTNGNIADNFYYGFKEDISLIKENGFDSFRFSISWPRILPSLEPLVTLFHWDLPQALEDQYHGFLSPDIVDDYRDYVDFCFKEFGDRVKHWTTFNEPNYFASGGYATGTKAPGRCSNYIGNCTFGNSGTEPYIVGHNMLLSHAIAVKLYREKYQASQKGNISITVASYWMVPKFQTVACRKAVLRALDFMFGWYVGPVTFGEYPETMQDLLGNRLPRFTASQSEMLKGSYDFLGVNYYTARYAEDSSSFSSINLSYTTDSRVNLTMFKDGIPIGQPTASSWLYVYPRGIRDLVLYVSRSFNNPPIYITENGVDGKGYLPIQDALNDSLRLNYHRNHLSNLSEAIKVGADVRAYYVWSFLDDFEWEFGYTFQFGLTYVDYKNDLKRYSKQSALWFKSFLQKENVTRPPLLYSE